MHGAMRLGALLSTAAAVACGGSVETGAGGSGATGSTTGNGTSTTSGTGGGSPSGCPAEAPTASAACEKEELICTYGEEPRPECRTSAICSGGTWLVNPPLGCAQPPPGICPPAAPPNNEVCPSDGVVCTYVDGTICGCTTCVAGPCMPPPPIWSCGPPPAGCPTIAPNAGTACAEDGQSCTYGNPCGLSGVVAFCTQGSWIWEIVPCPQ